MSLRANVVANYGGQIAASVLAFALAPLFVHTLGLEAWGLVGLLAVLSAWLNLMDAGFTPSITREIARDAQGSNPMARSGDLVRCVELVYLVMLVLVAAVVAGVSGSIATGWLRLDTLGIREASASIALMGLIVALRLYENIYRSILAGFQDLVTLNALSTLFAVVRWGGGLIYVLLSGSGVVGLFVWQAGAAALSLACFALVARGRLNRVYPDARLDFSALRRIKGFATGIAASSVLGLLLTQIDKILLSRLLPLSEFGFYMLATSLADALALLAAPLYGALMPRFAQLVDGASDAALGDLYLRVSQCLAAALMPCAMLLVLHGAGVVQAWTGSAEMAVQMAPLLALLALGRMINALLQLPAALQVAAGWTSLGAQLNLVAVLVLVPLILLTVPDHGAIAFAWCWVALNVGYLLVGSWLMHRRLLPALRNRWLFQVAVVPVALSAAWMAAAAWLIDLPAGRLGLALVLAALLAGAVVTLALALPAPRAMLRALAFAPRG